MEPVQHLFSYARQNSEFVIKLATDLKNSGVNVWLDQMDIVAGSRWDDSIQNALDASNGLLVVLSTASVESQNVMDEVSYAISKGKQIVPLMVENCTIPFRLARYQYIDFTVNYDSAFQQLLKTLSTNQSTAGIEKPKSGTGIEKPQKEKPHSNKKSSAPKTDHEKGSLKTSVTTNISKLTGILSIVGAVIMTLINKCHSNAEYFIIYALIGIGIALLLAKSAEKSTANVTIHNVGIVLGGGVALPFILFFTNPIGSFKPDNCSLQLSSTSTTVFVHGKKGKQDMILRQQGFVIMDLKGERKRASINENGQAFFQNLHVGDKVQLEVDFSEPYRSLYPDSIYDIPADGRIYLPVTLQGIDKVYGKVLYKEAPLEGVLIEIDELKDTTDKTGQFDISIPEPRQKKEYKVWFTKMGFKTKSAPAFPQTGQALEVVMEKKFF